MSFMRCSLTLTVYCIALLCSSVRAPPPALSVEPYSWRYESVASLSSLGYTETVGTIQPITEPSHMSATPMHNGTIPLPNPTPITGSALATTTSASIDCTIYIGTSVNVYYFSNATAATNTACYTGISQQPSALPSEVSTFVPPNIYLMITAISAGNEHHQIGSVYTSVILTLAPGQLSTIEGRDEATKAYNFADMPCPPPDVASRNSRYYNPTNNPTQPYRPRISIPPEVWKLDPAWSTCTFTVQYEGFDPPTTVNPSTSISGPQATFFPGRIRRGATGSLKSPTYANKPGASLVPPTASPTTVTTISPDSERVSSLV